ncbi:DedA family protein [Occultella aeris]|uniref:SNARE associated Golgi protein n=1 Tax=Occultella aeris TaxID=2761496 RepID=A0A7M4DQP1_9MICO|nr:VTT domain-containing protein [Occultella aeris]VZO39785.1 SNARE associated Golgi protein [Occultella aeris]
MPDFLAELPFWLIMLLLSCGAMLRGQGMYWAGRIVTEQALRRTHPTQGWTLKAHAWLQAGGADAGIRAIRRWGLFAVPVCYLTVGFQSMVQAGAGVLRITWWKYTLAQIPGAIAWGAIYATIGFAVWEAALAAAAGSPLGLAVIAALVVAVVVAVVVRRRSRRPAGPAAAIQMPDGGADDGVIDTFAEVVGSETDTPAVPAAEQSGAERA